MKTWLKVTLLSLGSLSVLAGIAGITYATNKQVHGWTDEHLGISTSSQSNSNAGVKISVDSADLMLHLRDATQLPTGTVTASLDGSFGSNDNVIWETPDSTALGFITLNTKSGQVQTIVAKKIFKSTLVVKAHSAVDYTVVAEVKVRIYNHLKDASLDTVYLYKKDESLVKGFACLSTGFAEYTYNPGNGDYFHINASTVGNGTATMETDPDICLTAKNVLDITASAGLIIDIQIKGWNFSPQETSGALVHEWDLLHPETVYYAPLTTSQFTLKKFYYQQNYTNDFYWLHVVLQVNEKTETGRHVIKLDNRYLSFNFTKYVPVAATA
jgi:hypothetical protein